jgi:DNA-binding SARP family transcriptional activator
VRVVGDLLELVAGAQLRIDADEFDRMVATGRAAEARRVPADAITAYLDAVRLYRGDYLADAPSPSWGEFERVRLRGDFVGVSVRTGELLLAAGAIGEAIRLAAGAVEAEPFTEAAHRLHARALREKGDRPGAWRVLSAAIDLLRAEGLEPEPETVRKHAALADPSSG